MCLSAFLADPAEWLAAEGVLDVLCDYLRAPLPLPLIGPTGIALMTSAIPEVTLQSAHALLAVCGWLEAWPAPQPAAESKPSAAPYSRSSTGSGAAIAACRPDGGARSGGLACGAGSSGVSGVGGDGFSKPRPSDALVAAAARGAIAVLAFAQLPHEVDVKRQPPGRAAERLFLAAGEALCEAITAALPPARRAAALRQGSLEALVKALMFLAAPREPLPAAAARTAGAGIAARAAGDAGAPGGFSKANVTPATEAGPLCASNKGARLVQLAAETLAALAAAEPAAHAALAAAEGGAAWRPVAAMLRGGLTGAAAAAVDALSIFVGVEVAVEDAGAAEAADAAMAALLEVGACLEFSGLFGVSPVWIIELHSGLKRWAAAVKRSVTSRCGADCVLVVAKGSVVAGCVLLLSAAGAF